MSHTITHLEKSEDVQLENGADALQVDFMTKSAEMHEAQMITLSEAKGVRQTFTEDRKVIFVIAAALSTAFVLGTDTTVVGSLVGSQSFCYVMGDGYMSGGKYAIPPRTNTVWSAVAAPAQVGGQFIMAPIADYFGRRAVIFAAIALMVVGVVIELVATNWKIFAAAKFILALVAGMIQATAPMYISELAPRGVRGATISVFLLIGNLGDIVSTLLCWGGARMWPSPSDKWAYRMPLLVCLILPLIIAVIQFFFACESPSWLIMHGKTEQARKTIKFMYPRRTDAERDLIYAEIEYTLGKEAEQRVLMKQASFGECFKSKDLRRTFCAFFPAMTASLAGNVLTGPQKTYFFTLSGQKNSLLSTVIALSLQTFAILWVFLLIERKAVGRKRLLLTGQFGLLISMIGIGATGLHFKTPYSSQAGAIMLGFLCIGVFSVTIGPNNVGWTYIGESGSLRLRAKTTTFGAMGNGIVGVTYNIAISYMLTGDALGVGGSALYFACFGVLDLIITYFFIPDYTGKSFAQIDELFSRGIGARKFQSTVCTGDYGRDIISEGDSARDGARVDEN